jgi:hypothetical protein
MKHSVATGPLERSNCRVHLRGRCRNLLTDAFINAGVADTSRRRRCPFRNRAGLPELSGSKRAAFCAGTFNYLESWDLTRQKNERGWFLKAATKRPTGNNRIKIFFSSIYFITFITINKQLKKKCVRGFVEAPGLSPRLPRAKSGSTDYITEKRIPTINGKKKKE